MPVVHNDDDWLALSPGELYIDPLGNVRRRG
jgi:hypothetical protein